MVSTILVVVALAACAITWSRKWIQKYYHQVLVLRKIPGPKAHWLTGNLLTYSRNGAGLKARIASMNLFQNLQSFWMGPFAGAVLVYSPSLVKNILTTSEPKSAVVYKLTDSLLGNGLVSSSGSLWKHNRKVLAPVFHNDMMRKYLDIMNQVARVLIGTWQNVEEADVYKSCLQASFDNIAQCVLSLKTDCLLNTLHEYPRAVNEVTSIFVKRLHSPIYWADFIYKRSNLYKMESKAVNVLRNYAYKAISERKKLYNSGQREAVKSKDFLDILLKAKDEKGNFLSDFDILSQINTFLVAGYETSASTMAFTLYCLAQNPEYQIKCREEVYEVLGDRDCVTWEDLSKLNFLTMCIKETMRLHGPATIISRVLSRSMKISINEDGNKITLPRGLNYQVFLYGLHRHPDIWKVPEKFDPLRFSSDNISTRPPYSYVPFSAGPRSCMGQNFGMFEMKVTLAHVLKNYVICVDNNYPEPNKFWGILMRPEKEISLKICKI